MAAQDYELYLRVRADMQQAIESLKGVNKSLNDMGSAAKAVPDMGSWSSGIGKVRDSLLELAGAYVGIDAVGKGIEGLFSALDRMSRMNELAKIAGVSVESFSKLAYAAQFTSTDMDTLAKGLDKLSKDMTSGSSVVGKLGISLRDAGGNTRDAGAVFSDLANVFSSIPDGAEKSALAAKIFGDRLGPGLIPILDLGKKGLDEFAASAAATGNVISGQASEDAEKFKENLEKLKSTLSGIANETVSDLIPSFGAYTQALENNAEQSNVAKSAGEFLANVFKVLASGGIIVKSVVGALANMLGFLGDIAGGVAKVLTQELVGSFSILGNAAKDIATRKNPVEVFKEIASGVSEQTKNTYNASKELADHLKYGWSAMTDGLDDAKKGIAGIGALFDSAASSSKKGSSAVASATDGIAGSAGKASPAVKKLMDIIRKLLAADGSGGGGGNGVSALAGAMQQLQQQILSLGDSALGPVTAIWDKYTKAMLAAGQAGAKAISAGGDVAQVQSQVAQIQQLAAQARDKALADQRAGLQEAYAQATGDQLTASRLQIQKQYGDMLDDMQRRGDTAGVALVEKLINVSQAQAQLQQLQSVVQQAFTTEQQQEQSVQAEQNAGLLTEIDARTRIVDLHQQTAAQVQALIPQMQQLALAIGSPQAIQGVQALQVQLEQLQLTTTIWQSTLEEGLSSGFNKAYSDIVSGTANLKTVLGDVLGSIADAFGKQALKNLAQSASKGLEHLLGIGDQTATAVAITTAGSTAATAMGTAISTAGVAAAQAMASAIRLASLGSGAGGGSSSLGALGSLFSMFGSSGSAAAGSSGMIGSWSTEMGSAMSMFASGGYTGDGAKQDVAGVVHAGEYVMPSERVRQPGALSFLADFHRRGTAALADWVPGFADGGLVGMAPRWSPAPPNVEPLPRLRLDDLQASTEPGTVVNNRMRVYVALNEDELMQRLATHPKFEKAVVAVAGQNGRSIQAQW